VANGNSAGPTKGRDPFRKILACATAIAAVASAFAPAVETVSDVEIPETLQASLLARLDRLGPEARELAQLAAVIGREFNAELLNAVAR
jgi:predicted ATPase